MCEERRQTLQQKTLVIRYANNNVLFPSRK